MKVGGVGSPLPDTPALANHGVLGVELLEEELARALPELDPDILVEVEILEVEIPLDVDDGSDELCFGFHALIGEGRVS